MKNQIALVILSTIYLQAIGQFPPRKEASSEVLSLQYVEGYLGDDIGENGMVVYDLDGDGQLEFITYGLLGGHTDGAKRWFILTQDSSSKDLSLKWMSQQYSQRVRFITLNHNPSERYPEIWIGLNKFLSFDGDFKANVKIFAVRNGEYREVNSYPLGKGFMQNFKWVNLDNSPEEEAAIVFTDSVLFIRPTDFSPLGRITSQVNDVDAADLNGDGVAEIVLGSGQMYEFRSGDVQFTKSYASDTLNFGGQIQLADVNNDGEKDIVFNEGGFLKAIDFETDSTIWEIQNRNSAQITRFILADLNQDSVPDPILENSSSTYAFDGRTGHEVWGPISLTGGKSTQFINFQGEANSHEKLALAKGNGIYVYNLPNLSQEAFYQTAGLLDTYFFLGDANNDDKDDLLLVGAGKGARCYSLPEFQIKDTRGNNFGSVTTQISVHDTDNNGVSELYFIPNGGGGITQISPVSFNYVNTLILPQAYRGLSITQFEYEDINQDEIQELVIAAGRNSPSGVVDHRFLFMNGEELLKEIQLNSQDVVLSQDFHIANVDDDEELEIVGVLHKFRDKDSLFLINLGDDTFSKQVVEAEVEPFEYFPSTSMDVYDYDRDGIEEIFIGTSRGQIQIIDPNTLTPSVGFQMDSTSIISIKVADVNNDGFPEVLYLDPYYFHVFDPFLGKRVWRSDSLNNLFIDNGKNRNKIEVANVDDDPNLEVLLGLNFTFYVFEALNKPFPDISVNTEGEVKEVSFSLISFPNPFSKESTIQYSLDTQGEVEISLYTIAGQHVSTLVHQSRLPGIYTRSFSALEARLNPGLYFCQMRINGELKAAHKLLFIE